MNIHVLPATAESINKLVDKTDQQKNTQGKIVDLKFGFGESYSSSE